MKVKFEIKVTTNDMYRFMMYHAYHGFSGIFSIAAGAGLILYYILNRTGNVANVWMYLVFGILFLIYQPWTLYTRAAKQVQLSPVFKKPLGYFLSEEGITVTQDENTSQITWDSICKVRETSRSILVYTSSRNAYIWVKSQMGKKEPAVRESLKKYVPARKLKLKANS